MTDTLTPEQRKRNMSSIRAKDTKPEMRLRSALWAKGLRYRLRSDLPGRPDILFPGARVAVFVDGCFWHGCPEHLKIPSTNREFWVEKLSVNARRDQNVNSDLKSQGWVVIRVWEHDIMRHVDSVACLVQSEAVDKPR